MKKLRLNPERSHQMKLLLLPFQPLTAELGGTQEDRQRTKSAGLSPAHAEQKNMLPLSLKS